MFAAALALTGKAMGTEIYNSQAAALDQPRINAYIALTPGGTPQIDQLFGSDTFNIQAYYDTGASGVLLSNNTAEALGVGHSIFNETEVIFSDVGVGGTSDFYVSNPVSISLAPFHPQADVDNINTYQSTYTQTFHGIRTQIGPAGVEPDPALGDLDVFGMPLMTGKVVVMDPRPVNTLFDTMRTYVYNPGTAFNPSSEHDDPGIPSVDRHVRMSYASFDRFTDTNPDGAAPPTLRTNPFIGPNPFLPGDTTPPVTLSFEGHTAQGSFLLDTGAAASIIANHTAGALGVTYQNNGDPDNPVLMYQGAPVDDQFTLTIGGIGGSKKVAGFYLSSLLLKTEEGNASNIEDPNHLKFIDAPVLVADISVQNPDDINDTYTLDGIFGMNFLVASARIEGTDASGFPIISELSRGNFDWVTFDEPGGKLGFRLATPTPQNELTWTGNVLSPGSSANHWNFDNLGWLGPNLFDVYADGDYVLFGTETLYDTIRLTEVVAPGGVTFNNNYNFDTAEGTNYDLTGNGRITGFTGLIKRGTGEVHIFTPNDYTGSTSVENGYLYFHASQNIGSLSVRPAGEVRLVGGLRQQFKSISVEGSLFSSGGNIVTETVGVTSTGRFDLSTSKLVIERQAGTDEALTLRKVLDASSGSTGLYSSAITDSRHAIGFADAASVFATLPSTWFGEAISGNELLVKVALKGDANLNGSVSFDDLLVVAQHYGQHDRYWWQGDFDYSGIVDFDDLLLIAQNYGGVGITELQSLDSDFRSDWSLALSLVPEPSSLAALSAIAFALPRHRRRRYN